MESCDRCSAQSKVTVVNETETAILTLCGHHFTENEVALMAAGWKIREDSRRDLAGV